MQPFSRLTVGLARTPADACTAAYAALVCRLGTVEQVRFVHVLPREGTSGPLAGREHVEAELRQTVAGQFTDVPVHVRVDYAVLSGPLTDQLLTEVVTAQSDLLLVGHGAGRSGRRALARRLAMNAPCSVWMVPEDSPSRLTRILAPLDFSDDSADTSQVAVWLARASGAAITALHVYFNEAVATYEEYDEILRGQERQAYEKFVAPIDRQGVELNPVFEEGANVANVIGRVAEREGADLIVMGTRGRSRSAAILLGSVTEQTIIDTRLPLLAVKHFGARMGVLQALLDRRFLFSKGLHTD